MSQPNLRQHLTGFYGDKSMSGGTVDRLVALADVDRGRFSPTVVYHYPGRWLQALVGVAASVALALSAAAYYTVQTSTVADRPVEPASRFVGDYHVGRDIPRVGATEGRDRTVPRLVALKFQVDGCPMAAGIEPVFAELAEKYADKPVMFARYDMTNAKSRCFSKSLATGLGINWACQGDCHSGTILLIDRDRREVLAKITNGQELPKMVQTLDRALN